MKAYNQVKEMIKNNEHVSVNWLNVTTVEEIVMCRKEFWQAPAKA